MGLEKTKWAMIPVAICLAILLALQPFLHAHMDSEQTGYLDGFHLGMEHEEVFNSVQITSHDLVSTPHASHIVSVDSSIKKEIDTNIVADAIVAIIISLFFVPALQLVQRLIPTTSLVLKESLKRQLQATRAPPQS